MIVAAAYPDGYPSPPLPSPQYGPAAIAACYGLTVDTMTADIKAAGGDIDPSIDPDTVAQVWCAVVLKSGVTVTALLDGGHV